MVSWLERRLPSSLPDGAHLLLSALVRQGGLQDQTAGMLSVSIVVYDRQPSAVSTAAAILRRAIGDVANHSFCDTIVVLDNSPVSTFSWTSELSPKVLYIHFSGSNLGYGRAHNVSRFLVQSEYHLVLNPDIVFLDPDSLPRLIAAMQENPRFAMVQPLIVSPDGQEIQ